MASEVLNRMRDDRRAIQDTRDFNNNQFTDQLGALSAAQVSEDFALEATNAFRQAIVDAAFQSVIDELYAFADKRMNKAIDDFSNLYSVFIDVDSGEDNTTNTTREILEASQDSLRSIANALYFQRAFERELAISRIG
jgi:hypothetical protein